MKRILSLLGILLTLSMPIFAQNKEDKEIDDDDNYVQEENYVYRMNGRGDQFIKIGLMPNFPMNFGDKLYIGGAAQLGYYRYFNSWLAFGGELMAGYNPTLGSNVLTFVPITLGFQFLPAVWRFEFPITTSMGIAFETCANKKYFPGFVGKVEVGSFFRITEGWSVGLSGQWLYLPEWYTTTKNAESDFATFLQAAVSARYHF